MPSIVVIAIQDGLLLRDRKNQSSTQLVSTHTEAIEYSTVTLPLPPSSYNTGILVVTISGMMDTDLTGLVLFHTVEAVFNLGIE